ncbi:FAD-dependent oxidoreductase [Rhizobium sp. NZLR1]|uniref:NAD(P)/FAD-dependent oxidoreductase n=1 Tax=Rhizobium sp. NZLR1 TaxID=2731096 RepID=UPI001A992A93|nr:FAD-dependent oxidoreductase [Rhizobium sp. NZLR1]MBX5204054.1 FAD-dependent oxidoreductase [Rhizobium sp. NZLR1]QSZ25148.1 FAD-dependent oxidoreductase [Rhizobium sp. NZLR1]
MHKKAILVIGGGAAGHQIAYQLRDVASVTLVDPKTYWEVPMAVPRLLVDPAALSARIGYGTFLGSGRHVQGKVVQLGEAAARVALTDGGEETLDFDYAVIATGSRYLDPLIKAQAPSEQERAAELQDMNQRLKAARSIAVVGGGPVGIETAAELRETLPGAKVTLIHAGRTVLDKAPSKFPAWAQQYLRSKDVEIIVNDLVVTPTLGEQPKDRKVVTRAGRAVAADVIIWAAGTQPVTDFVASSWPGAVDRNGHVKVDEHLRVPGHPRVFAVGDITNLPENRLAIIAGLHAKSVVANIKKLLSAREGSDMRLKPYKPARPGKGMGRMMVVTLGRTDGLTSLPFGQFRASFLAKKIKAHDMLVGMSRKALGL